MKSQGIIKTILLIALLFLFTESAHASSITVNAADETAVIDKGVLGTNICYYQAQSRTLDNPTFMGRMNELKPSIVRWPSGNQACVYNWKTDTYWGEDVSWGLNIKDIYTLCQLTGMQLQMVVNFGTMNAQDAADLVMYCNGTDPTNPWVQRRISDGFPEPLNVRYWEIGNELDLPHMWDYSWTAQKANKYYFGGEDERFGTFWRYQPSNTFTSDGQPNQQFILGYQGIIPGTETVAVGLSEEEYTIWERVDSFEGLSGGNYYRLDRIDNQDRLIFSDGIQANIPPEGQYIYITYYTQEFHNTKGDILRSNGEPNLEFSLRFPPLKPDSQLVRIGPNTEEFEIWTRVESLQGVGRGKYYELDYATGELRFGDGINGDIPEYGDFILCEYITTGHDGYVTFYDKMKAVDPTIKIGSCFEPPRQWILSYPNEWEAVISRIDFRIYHNYYAQEDNRTPSEYLFTMTLPQQDMDKLFNYRDVIDYFYGEYADNIELALTEYNFLLPPNVWGGGETSHNVSLASGIFMAEKLRGLIANQQTLKLFLANQFNAISYGYLSSMRIEDYVPHPEYYAFDIFTRHFGDILVSTQVDSDYYTVASYSNPVPYLTAIASKNSTGNKLYLVVINKHETEDYDVPIEILGVLPQEIADCWTLNGPDVWATNEENPYNVFPIHTTFTGVSNNFSYLFPAHSVTALEIALTVDTTPPVLSDVQAVDITSDSATIIWSTDEPATSKVEYGGDVSQTIEDLNLATAHSITITGLEPLTTYYYQVSSKDAFSNEAVSDIYSFTTEMTPSSYYPPVWDPPIGDKETDEGQLLRFTVTATDPDNDPLTLTAVGSPLERGASFIDHGNGTGTFSWRPDFTQAGDYNVTFTATDSRNAATSETITIAVYNVNRPPVLSYIPNQTVNEGQLLMIGVSAIDPDNDPLSYFAYDLPQGASFSNQVFRWTPDYTQAGDYYVIFTVSDGALSDSQPVKITVVNVNRAPELAPIGNKTVNEGELLQFTISATDPDNDPLTYSASNLPSGATFNPSTRVFSWAPDYTQADTYNVTFTVSDGSLNDSEPITITVNDMVSAQLTASASYVVRGNSITFYSRITNLSSNTINVDSWVDDTLPDNRPNNRNPIVAKQTITLAAYQTQTITSVVTTRRGEQVGTHTTTLKVSEVGHPSNLYAASSINVEVRR